MSYHKEVEVELVHYSGGHIANCPNLPQAYLRMVSKKEVLVFKVLKIWRDFLIIERLKIRFKFSKKQVKTHKEIELRCDTCGEKIENNSIEAQISHQIKTGHRLYTKVFV